MSLKSLVLAVALAVSGAANAGSAGSSGNDYLTYSPLVRLFFVSGLHTGMTAAAPNLGTTYNGLANWYCAPEDATFGQVLAVFDDWLAKNPSKLHVRTVDLFAMAMIDAWPCEAGSVRRLK